MRALAASLVLLALLAPAVHARTMAEVWDAEGDATWRAGGFACEGKLAMRAVGPIAAGEQQGAYWFTLDATASSARCAPVHEEGFLPASPRANAIHILREADDAGALLGFAADDEGARQLLYARWSPERGDEIDLASSLQETDHSL